MTDLNTFEVIASIRAMYAEQIAKEQAGLPSLEALKAKAAALNK